MRNQLLFAVLLTGIAGAVQAGPIERAVVEQTGPDAYTITFDAPKDAFPVRAFGIPRPGCPGAARELAQASQSRVEVHVPTGSGQPFFRLQPAKGDPVVVSIRRLPLEGAPNFREPGRISHVGWPSVALGDGVSLRVVVWADGERQQVPFERGTPAGLRLPRRWRTPAVSHQVAGRGPSGDRRQFHRYG